MKNFINGIVHKRWLKIGIFILTSILVVLFIFYGVPQIVKYLKIVRIDSKCDIAFSQSDLLIYYGSVLGAMATIIAVVLTIRYSVFQMKKQEEYQYKIINGEIKKKRLEERYQEQLKVADKIRKLFFLELLDEEHALVNIIFSRTVIAEFTKEFLEISNYIENLHMDYSTDKLLAEEIGAFISNTKNVISEMVDKINDAEIEKEKFKHREDYNESMEKEKKQSIECRVKDYENLLMGRRLKDNNEDTIPDDKPLTSMQVIKIYEDKLKEYRDKHKDAFMKCYNNFVKNKKDNLQIEIEKLFN